MVDASNEQHQIQSRGSSRQQEGRGLLHELFRTTPIPTEELVTNLGLYMRSSVLAKVLYVNELYELITRTPGVIMEFGVWWGQNLALFENLRAVYEPYNYTRRILGFDTFEGYASLAPEDGSHQLASEGQYAVSENYLSHLRALLGYHQNENPMGHLPRIELIAGDATATIATYLDAHPETVIALAYFDMQLYKPTKACLEAIKPYVTRGTVIAMDEINTPEFPGETVAFKEVWGLDQVRLVRSQFLPDRSYFIID